MTPPFIIQVIFFGLLLGAGATLTTALAVYFGWWLGGKLFQERKPTNASPQPPRMDDP